MATDKIIKELIFEDFPLLPYDGPEFGYRESILRKIKERLEEALTLTSQCLAVRLVIRFPEDLVASPDNDCFQYFLEEYRRSLKDKLIHYVWVRERHSSHNHHYHLLLLFDGNLMRYFAYQYMPTNLWLRSIAIFYNIESANRGLIHQCSGDNYISGVKLNHGIMVHRDNHALTQAVYQICSYFAKVYSKGSSPKNIREFGVSYLKSTTPK